MLEANLLKNLSHPNIVSYKTSFIEGGQLIIVMEYCEGNYLFVLKANSGRLVFPYKEEAVEGGNLFRNGNLQLVCADLSCTRVHSREEGASQRLEDLKHISHRQ